MTVVRGHFDGRRVELDEPAPSGISPPVTVKIVFEDNAQGSVLDRLAALADDDDLPADYSAQHEHYVKGTVR